MWFNVSLSVAVRVFFSSVSLSSDHVVFFFSSGLPDCPVGSAACTCTSQRVLAAADRDTKSCCGPFSPSC